MMGIVRKRHERSRIGKSSDVRLRKRPISLENQLRFMRRKGFTLEDILARSPKTPDDLEILTPTSSVPDLLVPDAACYNVYHALSHYVSGSFDANVWSLHSDGKLHATRQTSPDTAAIFRWYNTFDDALSYMSSGDITSLSHGGQLLIKAGNLTPEILLHEHPRSVDHVLRFVDLCARRNRPDICRIVLGHILGMTGVLLPSTHPLRPFLAYVKQLVESADYASVRAVWSHIINLIASRVSHMQEDIRVMVLAHKYAGISQGSLWEGEAFEKQLISGFRDAEAQNGRTHFRTIRYPIYIARYLFDQGRFVDSESMILDFLDRVKNPVPHWDTKDYIVSGLICLSDCRRAIGDLGGAETYLDQARRLTVKDWEWKVLEDEQSDQAGNGVGTSASAPTWTLQPVAIAAH